MSTNNVKYRLGLDMGTNSIGWAAVKLDTDDKPCGILDMGVRIFPDGRNPNGQDVQRCGAQTCAWTAAAARPLLEAP